MLIPSGQSAPDARDVSALSQPRVLLSFRGPLDQDCLETFTSHLERDTEIASAEQRRRVTNVMIELGQNIIRHGLPASEQNHKTANRPALQVVRDERGLYVEAESPAREKDAEKVKSRMAQLRDLSPQELERCISFQLGKDGGIGLMEVTRASAQDRNNRRMVEVDTYKSVGGGIEQLSIRAYVR